MSRRKKKEPPKVPQPIKLYCAVKAARDIYRNGELLIAKGEAMRIPWVIQNKKAPNRLAVELCRYIIIFGPRAPHTYISVDDVEDFYGNPMYIDEEILEQEGCYGGWNDPLILEI